MLRNLSDLEKLKSILDWMILNWHQHKTGVISALLILYILFLQRQHEVSIGYHHETIGFLEQQVQDYEGCRTGSPFGDKPIRATFTDNRIAYVNFFHSALPVSSAPISDPGWQDNLSIKVEEMRSSVTASVLTELESVSLEYARTHRTEIEARIFMRIEPSFADREFQLRQFSLLEFCEPFTIKKPSDEDGT